MDQYIGLEFQFRDQVDPYHIIIEGDAGLITRLFTQKLSNVKVTVVDHVPGVGFTRWAFNEQNKG